MTRGLRAAAKQGIRQYATLTGRWRALPDFLIIGVKRGGTTSMWNYLIRHPSVLPMFPAAQQLKSSHYFYANFHRGLDWYRSHFPIRRPSGTVVGEASPYYLYYPHAPARIRAVMPDVKIVVLLRDPVERAYSHFRERTNNGVEDLSFEEALAAEETRTKGEWERMLADPLYYSKPHDYYTYRDRGIYLPQLQRWHEHFPREQLLLVRSEDMYADPEAAFQEVTDFLGVPRHPLVSRRKHNFHPAEPIAPATRAELTEFFTPHNAALYDYLGRDFGWPKASAD